jgi:hypothetical protein
MPFPKIRFADSRQFARRLVRSKLLWSLAALLLLYTFAGFLLAPYLIERYLPSFAQERLGRRASVEKVRINPYGLTFEASGFRLEDKGDKPLLAFRRFFVDFELSSIVKRAWTFADIQLENAELGLEIDRNARLNLLDVLDRLRKAPEPDAPPVRLVVEHLGIVDSKVSLTDLSGASRADAVFEPIDLELRNLSTLADSEGRYTLDARLPAGGTLAWKGSLSLQPITSAGELSIRGMKLESPWRFRRAGLNLTEPRGDVSIAGRYDFSYVQGQSTLVLNDLQGEVANLSLALRGKKQPLLALRTIKLSDASFALAKRELVVQKLILANGALNATVSDAGVLDWQGITATADGARAAPQETAQPSQGEPWHIRFLSVAVEKVALGYTDESTTPALAVRTALDTNLSLDITTGPATTRIVADEIALALKTTALTIPGSETRYAALDALTVKGGRVDTQERSVRAKLIELKQGNIALAIGPAGPEGLLKALSTPPPASTTPSEASTQARPSQAQPREREKAPSAASAPSDAGASWRVQIDKIGVEKLAFQYDDKSTKAGFSVHAEELNGAASLDASAGAGAARIVAADLQLGMERVRLDSQSAEKPLATVDSFSLSGGRVDTSARAATIKSIALSGGGIRLARGPDGASGLVDAFASKQAQTPARAREATNSAASEAWRYRVDSASLKRFSVALADESYKPRIAYDLDVGSITANNIDSASKKPVAFTASLRVGKNGIANAKGALQQDFTGASAQIDLARIPLEPLQPLLARYATLDLKSGQLAAKARVAFRRARQPQLVARGEVAAADVLINEAGTNERFASFKTLAAEDAELNLSPDKLVIRQVRVVQPDAKIVIAPDRTVNLSHVIKKEPAPERAPPNASAQSTTTTAEAPAFPYDIATIRFQDGALDFADLSLVLPFSTRVHALQGAIVGLSSDPQARAQVELTGQVDKYGEARADGSLLPRDPTKFLDITARFDNIELGPFSPYSATFAGRKIDQGKLALVLEYKIVNSQLAGENRIALRDFKLGERVEAPGAMNLPLDLAVALLKDSQGRINLEVPVHGNVGSPEFDYGKVIRAAIANVLTRIVTAPFRALAGLFGKRDAEAVRTVSFAPGSDAIAPAEREQLDAIAKALSARPQLGLVVKGPYDPAQDARELKRRAARLELARAVGAKLEAGQDPGPIAYDRADTQRALEKLLAQRAGPDAMAQLEKAFAKRTGRQPDRVNPVLGLFGRGSKDTEFYEAVFDRLVDAEPLPDTAVRELAASREQAIVETLAKAGIDRRRLSSGGLAQVKADPKKGITTELALEAMPAAS